MLHCILKVPWHILNTQQIFVLGWRSLQSRDSYDWHVHRTLRGCFYSSLPGAQGPHITGTVHWLQPVVYSGVYRFHSCWCANVWRPNISCRNYAIWPKVLRFRNPYWKGCTFKVLLGFSEAIPSYSARSKFCFKPSLFVLLICHICFVWSQVATMTHLASSYLNAGVVASRHGTGHGSIVPYQV